MFPPIEAYAVNFANGNLQPHFNPYGWPDVRLSAQTPGVTAASADSKGYRLSCMATGGELANSLYLVLPQPSPAVLGTPTLPADVRAYLRVVFDLPHAVGADGSSAFAQAWAVSANLRIDRNIDSPSVQQLNVTSQFVSGSSSGVTIEGVRLNTPGSLQQIDQQRRLDGPLDYARYQPVRFGPFFELPGAIFVLDHAFCGYAAATNGHTPGSGKLRIRWFFGADKRDQRVYSSQELMKTAPLPAGATIGAVGVSIATLTGVGTFGARVRSFQLWLDRALGPFAPEVTDQ
jgi:hypothetical protein